MKRGSKSIINILVAVFIIGFIFYSFLFWKVSKVPSQQLSFGQKIKIIFTWNPAEILFGINNKWDSSYAKNQNILPASSFSDLKTVIEQATKKPIVFSLLGETIVFDGAGKSIINRGTIAMEDGARYKFYDYEIYLNATKTVSSYEADHKAGITITQKAGKISDADFEKNKEFSAAALLTEKNIDWQNTKGKNGLKISVSGLVINQFQLSYGSNKQIDKNILFDLAGKITEDTKR
jgi:hypothetical protein